MSHVTLIRSAWLSSLFSVEADEAAAGSPPLGLAYIAAALKHGGHQVCVIDALGEDMSQVRQVPGKPISATGLSDAQIIERIPRHTDLIGFSEMFSADWLAHKLTVRAVHQAFPDKPIILGGEHATADAAYILRHEPHVRACVRGEGEETLLELLDAMSTGRDWREVPGLCLRDAESGKPMTTAARKRVRKLDTMPWPAWEEVPIEAYLAKPGGFGFVRGRSMPMLASRGCPFACTFCSNPDMWGQYWNARDPADVVAEIEHYRQRYGIDSFYFDDSTAIVRKDWILQFANLLESKKTGLMWCMPAGTRSEAMDEEVLAALKRSGCPKVSYAPESGSTRMLDRIKKRVDLDRMLSSMRAGVRQGVIVKAHMIMGFPSQTLRDILSDYKFLVRMAWAGVSDVPVYVFNPYPGSALHDEIKSRGGFPEEGEAYEEFLASSLGSGFRRVRSWSDHIGDRQLFVLVWGAMAFFYTCQFLFRPWRVALSLYRMGISRPATMYERFPEVMARKLLRFRRRQPLPAAIE